MLFTRKFVVPVTFVAILMTSTYMISQRHRFEDSRTILPMVFQDNEIKAEEKKETLLDRELAWKSIFEQRQNKSRQKHLPHVIGLGVKKCGTGALIHFLGQHPLIKLPARVETYFFNNFYPRGIGYYKKIMPMVADDELAMEKTPAYFYGADKVIERIKKVVPNAKLILSLCNPAKRAFSDFVHETFAGHKDDNGTYFPEAFDALADKYMAKFTEGSSNDVNEIARNAKLACAKKRKPCIIANGIYQYSARKWLENFNNSQLLIVNGDEWITDPGGLIERIQEFLGIPKLILRKDFILSPQSGFYCLNRWWNKKYGNVDDIIKTNDETILGPENEELYCLGNGKGRTRNGVRTMFPKTYEKLRKFYEPQNNLLYNMLNRSMLW